MSRFWSSSVHNLAPYMPGEQPTDPDIVKLNTNECPYGPSPTVLDAIRKVTDRSLRLYPNPMASNLVDAIAATFGLSPDHVFAGNGSGEILAHSFNAFFQGNKEILAPDITYGFYQSYCRLYGISLRPVPLSDDFTIDIGGFSVPCDGIVIANPNSPTGVAMGVPEIERILQANPDVVVLVDEAYVDFGADSVIPLVSRYDNLLVVQTFSKSRGLAGMRVGFAVAQPHLIEGLQRIKDSFNPYPLDRLALAGALAAWQDVAWFEEIRQTVMADREMLTDNFRALGFSVLPSKANFLFVKHPDLPGDELGVALRQRGILARHFDSARTREWLRISIGTSRQCVELVDATNAILANC